MREREKESISERESKCQCLRERESVSVCVCKSQNLRVRECVYVCIYSCVGIWFLSVYLGIRVCMCVYPYENLFVLVCGKDIEYVRVNLWEREREREREREEKCVCVCVYIYMSEDACIFVYVRI